MIFFCMGMAQAGSTASLAVPSASHSFASVTALDVMGLGINPASAVGDSKQFSIDVGLILFAMDIDILGPEQTIVEERYGELPSGWNSIRGNISVDGMSPSPNLSLRIPIGSFGIGWNTYLPYATGGTFDKRGAQRYFATSGQLIFLENSLSLAKSWKFGENKVQVGGSVRHLYGNAITQASNDTGSIIYGLTGDDSLLLDPIMEGEKYASGTGQSVGYGVGFHVDHPRFSVHGAYRSSVPIELTGDFENQFSTSLTVSVQGASSISMILPQELYLGFTTPLSESLRFRFDGGWVNWAQNRYTNVRVGDIEVVSESPFFQEILESYNLTTNDLITADQNLTIDSGMKASYFARGGLDIHAHDTLELRSRVGYSTAAVPLEYMTFSNGDYSAIQLDIGGIWKPFSWGRFALNTMYLVHPQRVVERDMSVYSPYNDSQEGRSGLSGEGTYQFFMGRIGSSLIVDF